MNSMLAPPPSDLPLPSAVSVSSNHCTSSLHVSSKCAASGIASSSALNRQALDFAQRSACSCKSSILSLMSGSELNAVESRQSRRVADKTSRVFDFCEMTSSCTNYEQDVSLSLTLSCSNRASMGKWTSKRL